MKILVCFKIVPEFEQVVDDDWEHFDLATNIAYVKRSFGCFDETALETALRLKDALYAQGEKAECSALTLGSLPPSLCKTLFAAGFDRIHVLEASAGYSVAGTASAGYAGLEFKPWETAAVLEKFIRGGGWDLILAGRQTGYADTGMVPLILAEKLSLPVITHVESLSPLGSTGLSIDRCGISSRERIAIRLPALLIMGNSPVSSLRAATLAAQLQAGKRKAELSAAGNAVGTGLEDAPQLIWERADKTCRFLPGGSDIGQSAVAIIGQLKDWGFR